MNQENSLKNGEFEKLRPQQYSNFVNKFNSKTIIFPYNKGKNHWVIYIVINHHNSKLIHTHIEEKIEKDISEEQSNEEFPCIICFDSLSFNNPKRISSTVIVPGNKLVVGDKVSVFLWMFLNHIQQTNVFNHYTLPLFYAKCQSQTGMSCGYHAMMNMFTLTKFSGEYIPVKFKETGITMKSLKSYVDNKDEGEKFQLPNKIFFERETYDEFRFGLNYQPSLENFYSHLEKLISRMNYLYYIVDLQKQEGKTLEKLFENACEKKRWS